MLIATRTKKQEEIPDAEIFILQGDDEIATAEVIHALKMRYIAGGFSEMNFIHLDGQSVSKAELAKQINTLSLGGGSRLIVLGEALEFIKKKEDAGWLEDRLVNMPEGTRVVILVPDSKKFVKGQWVWQAVGPNHAFRSAIEKLNRRAAWLERPKPLQREMPHWIVNQAAALGVQIESSAAYALANLVGNDLYQAKQELIKAASYAGQGQLVTREMIHLLCSPSREEDIFALVDEIGQRRPGRALALLNALMREEPIQYIFSMVARQIRLLIITKEIMEEGGDQNTVAAELGMHAFIAKKLATQAQRFTMHELQDIYCQLDRIDEGVKSGRATLEVTLETLIADLSRSAGQPEV